MIAETDKIQLVEDRQICIAWNETEEKGKEINIEKHKNLFG